MSWPEVAVQTVAPMTISILVIIAGYVIGCLNAGYYIVRARSGFDIRREGSGATGATNVGRSLGGIWFAITLILDMAKAVFVVWLAIRLRLPSWAVLLSMLSVIAGHIWPVQLGFRGGKGIAPLLGSLLAVDYFIIFVAVGLFSVLFVMLRRFTLSGLAALALTVPALACWAKPPGRAFGFFILTVPVLYAHRQNLREDLSFGRRKDVEDRSAGPPSQEE